MMKEKQGVGKGTSVRLTAARSRKNVLPAAHKRGPQKKGRRRAWFLIPDSQTRVGHFSVPEAQKGGSRVRPEMLYSPVYLHTGKLREWGRVSPADKWERVQKTMAG